MQANSIALDPHACYQALCSRDARFDGHFYIAVKTTGIYCRPVCKVRTPMARNCLFFSTAARAEGAGFRPCLRCRPELAPALTRNWSTQDAGHILATQALQLLDSPLAFNQEPLQISALAQRLGISQRHLRRILIDQLGVTPSMYRQTRRLLMAKQLLCDTTLPMSVVAQLSGFGSQRRFNTVFARHYRLTPTQCRRTGAAQQGVCLQLSYRPPYDHHAMLDFLQLRAVPGLEHCGPDAPGQRGFARIVRLWAGHQSHLGWLRLHFAPQQHRVQVQISDSLLPALPVVLQQVRHVLDLDADPLQIESALGKDLGHCTGWRVPGAFDGFELAVRAVLGQQITVAAARTLTQRLVQALGEPHSTPWPTLTHAFPTPQALLQASADTLGQLGIVRQRQKAIQALAHAVQQGLRLEPGVPIDDTLQALMALPGVGDWTAQYIAMRALRWPDAFPAGDIVVQQRLGVRQMPQAARAATQLASHWQPWRSYAVIRLWHGDLK
jgi:AraC family transcriptional regulator, regulatory protein of adaptative response / DNA-3-methyladenine glycosylase II